MEDWYGVVKGVKFSPGEPIGDPSLIYKGLEFNYWDIEYALYDMFKEDLIHEFEGDEFLVSIDYDLGTDSDEFAQWLENNQDTVTGYFDDVIHGGYFNETL